jgi:hypothetical protein
VLDRVMSGRWSVWDGLWRGDTKYQGVHRTLEWGFGEGEIGRISEEERKAYGRQVSRRERLNIVHRSSNLRHQPRQLELDVNIWQPQRDRGRFGFLTTRIRVIKQKEISWQEKGRSINSRDPPMT